MKTTQFLAVITMMVASPLVLHAADITPKPYPLQTCFISGDELGGMGKVVVFTYEGQEIKLCCKSCQKDFKKDPSKYIKKLASAGKTDKK